LPSEAVLEAPILRAGRLHEQIEPLAVGELARFVVRLRIAASRVGQRHFFLPRVSRTGRVPRPPRKAWHRAGGIVPQRSPSYPRKYPQVPPDVSVRRGTAMDKR